MARGSCGSGGGGSKLGLVTQDGFSWKQASARWRILPWGPRRERGGGRASQAFLRGTRQAGAALVPPSAFPPQAPSLATPPPGRRALHAHPPGNRLWRSRESGRTPEQSPAAQGCGQQERRACVAEPLGGPGPDAGCSEASVLLASTGEGPGWPTPALSSRPGQTQLRGFRPFLPPACPVASAQTRRWRRRGRGGGRGVGGYLGK